LKKYSNIRESHLIQEVMCLQTWYLGRRVNPNGRIFPLYGYAILPCGRAWKQATKHLVQAYYKVVAEMPQQTRCNPFNNGCCCAGQMHRDLPSLVQVDPMEEFFWIRGSNSESKRSVLTGTKRYNSIHCARGLHYLPASAD
jgi:hypothetical protein